MRKGDDEPTTKDRRRFAFERAGELWLSDVMHAVPVEVEGRRSARRTCWRCSTTPRGW